MHLAGIARYPVKGLPGESLDQVRLARGRGVPGDRRFAFGIDASKDDGTWYSSRNYLINSRKDNLLKFAHQGGPDGWTLTSPEGQSLRFDAGDAQSLARLNAQLGPFMRCVENEGKTPVLIDRNPDEGPKGHWDFPDTELLVINLATLRALEQLWQIAIDPRRFRANLLIDGLPAWAEFGLYGAEYAMGGAAVTFLRPARRCAALSVNPTTGDRDVALQNDLVRDYGHGFMGVYARVTQTGGVGVGDRLTGTDAPPLTSAEMTCDIAPDITLWPKTAQVRATDAPDTFDAVPIGPLPLAQVGAQGRIKLHLRPERIVEASLVSARADGMTLHIPQAAEAAEIAATGADPVVLSGPFTAR